MSRWIAVIVAAVVLAGCGGNKHPTVPTTTSTSVTTARQAASILAKHKASLEAALGHECADGTCVGAVPQYVEQEQRETVQVWDQIATEVGALRKDLGAALPVEAEVKSLTLSTLDALARALDVLKKFKSCYALRGSFADGNCQAERDAWLGSVAKIPPLIDAWQPYL